jgi:predicted signal transduction protein with EAL and GGDEF domain
VKRAEDLRGKIEALTVRYLEQNLPRITISVGVAAFPEAGDNPQLVLKAADDALYRAKEGGRNRVESSAAPVRSKGSLATVEQLVPDTDTAIGKRSVDPGKFAAE